MEGRDLRATYEDDLNRLKTAQKNAAVADLEKTRNQALSDLQAERNQNASFYNQQRSSANAQNRLSARNFQEYLAQTGRANSGLSAQARMQNANNLNTSINALNVGEAGALADINRRTTDAQNAYNTGLASANANIEANYIQNLIEQRNKELERDLAERQFQESIRQFNENQALQRAAMYSKSSGSGGGSSQITSKTNYDFSDTSNAYDNIKDGQLYAVDTGTQTIWYQKNANGKDKVVLSPYATTSSTTSNKKTTTSNKKTTTSNKNPFPSKGTLTYKSK